MYAYKQTFIPNTCKQTTLSVDEVKQSSKVRIHKSFFPTFKPELCSDPGVFFVSDYQRSLLEYWFFVCLSLSEVGLDVPNCLKAPVLLLSSSVLSIADDTQIFFWNSTILCENCFLFKLVRIKNYISKTFRILSENFVSIQFNYGEKAVSKCCIQNVSSGAIVTSKVLVSLDTALSIRESLSFATRVSA